MEFTTTDFSTKQKSEIGYYKNSRAEMLKYIPVDALKILEVGCGEGAFCELLKSRAIEIWGIDINPEAATIAANHCHKVLIGDLINIHNKIPKSYFDAIVFNDVLEHMYDPWTTIRMAKGLLAPRGIVVASIPNFRYISNLITEILFGGQFRYKVEGGILDDTHIRFFTSKSMLQMFRNEGYEVLLHEGIRPCKSWKEKLFINLALGLLKDIRYKQYVTVAKPLL